MAIVQPKFFNDFSLIMTLDIYIWRTFLAYISVHDLSILAENTEMQSIYKKYAVS